MPRERACRSCKHITTSDRCPVCGSTNLSFQYSGLIVVMDVEKSEVAKVLGIRMPGKYALRVE